MVESWQSKTYYDNLQSYDVMNNQKFIISNILSFILGIIAVYGIYRIDRHWQRLHAESSFGLPNNPAVHIDSTNLPILLINTEGSRIAKDDYITARMVIIQNGNGANNYADTLKHPGQRVDYDGYIAIRYRGNSSFHESLKKPYAIRTLDKPLEMGGVKTKKKLLGMRKGKKWALLAPYSDRSMIRDALT